MRIFKTITVSIALLSLTTPLKAQTDTVSKVYELGEIAVTGSRYSRSLSSKIGEVQLREFNRDNATEALNLLPGLTITEAGARNEGQIYLRGFNLLQIPVFYDGIPIYVPYDGNVDINRFTTYDLSEVTVSKGLTSVLYGPNTMGGAINLVSRKPVKELEVWGLTGMKLSGEGANGYNTSVSVGSKQELFYALGSFSYVNNKFATLSKNFVPGTNEDGGKRENSATEDLKFSAKAGFTPNATDEYSINYIVQKAEKGIPPGVEGSQFRSYPQYDKQSVYFRSKTALGETMRLDATAFYDNYYNIMCQYDDGTYTTQNKNSAFRSVYDDYSAGGSLNLAASFIPYNSLKLSLYEKYDSHSEHNVDIPANEATGQNEKTGEPVQKYLDNTFAVGLEDVITVNEYLDIVAGLNYSYRGNMKAQEYGTHYDTGEKNVLYDFPTGSDDALNYQLAVLYKPAVNHEVSLSASRKSRFASQKDRYSSKFGSVRPNPDLKSEFSWIYDLTYKGQINSLLQYELSLYYNDIDNAIYQVTIPGEFASDGVTPLYQNKNVGKSFSTGYEISLGFKPIDEITIGGSYSYIYRENGEDKALRFTDVPAKKGILYGRFGLPHRPQTYLHIDWEAYSKRFYTSDGETLPGYGLLNAKIFSAVWSGLSLEAGARNLLDKNYFLSYNYPREGRTFFVSLKYDF
ncbi:MAG: TonB-dependent receptor [Tannerella sp.]|jgi:iron complex outermembrane receptor protein|nr:TonB-dependent receptor [Tannerella sp.]